MPATLALFEADELHPMTPQGSGVAFSVDADAIDVVRYWPREVYEAYRHPQSS